MSEKENYPTYDEIYEGTKMDHEFRNKVLEVLDKIGKAVDKLSERLPECNCPYYVQVGGIGYGGTSWSCPVHGRQNL